MFEEELLHGKAQHLFQRVAEHKKSTNGNHFHKARARRDLSNESHFKRIVLRLLENKNASQNVFY